MREHNAEVPVNYKATQRGFLATAQSDETAQYTVDLPGDMVGNLYWHKNTRAVGAWGKIIPCVATDANGSILPIADQSLAGDSAFAAKTVVLEAATNDHTKAMSVTGSLPASGEIGYVVQTVDQDTFELLWFPAASTVLKCDNVSPTTYSTRVYGVTEAGAPDPANYGTFDDVFFIEDNEIGISTLAKFRLDVDNKGPLAFEETAFPELNAPETPEYVVEVKQAFDATTGKWRLYAEF